MERSAAPNGGPQRHTSCAAPSHGASKSICIHARRNPQVVMLFAMMAASARVLNIGGSPSK
jgi:hypothetical protein